jgi:hypothetical protein
MHPPSLDKKNINCICKQSGVKNVLSQTTVGGDFKKFHDIDLSN